MGYYRFDNSGLSSIELSERTDKIKKDLCVWANRLDEEESTKILKYWEFKLQELEDFYIGLIEDGVVCKKVE